MKKGLIRASLILFWVILIFSIIYLPNLGLFPSRHKQINIFTWGDILEPSVVADFENSTGIKVNLNYYTTNEELLVKMKATGGVGYDLIIPSDYAVKILAQEGFLKAIDHQKLTFWNEINPFLLGHPFDPENTYSIPLEWELFGLGINKEYFETHPITPSWDMVFDADTVDYKITMLNDPIEAIQMAAYYLFGPVKTLSSDQIIQVQALLDTQKQWVEAYADFRGDYFLATRNCPVVVASSSYIKRSMNKFPFIGFVVPEKETFITIENLAIPKSSDKDELIYQFINYLFSKEPLQKHYDQFGFFPSTLITGDELELDPEMKSLLQMTTSGVYAIYFFEPILPGETMRKVWIELKTP